MGVGVRSRSRKNFNAKVRVGVKKMTRLRTLGFWLWKLLLSLLLNRLANFRGCSGATERIFWSYSTLTPDLDCTVRVFRLQLPTPTTTAATWAIWLKLWPIKPLGSNSNKSSKSTAPPDSDSYRWNFSTPILNFNSCASIFSTPFSSDSRLRPWFRIQVVCTYVYFD